MRTDDVNEIDESSLSGKFKAILGYALCLNQGISGRKRVRVEVLEAGPHSVKVADLIRCIKRSPRELATGSEMFRLWHDELPKPHIGSGLEALQAAFFDQFVTEPTETKSSLVVAEVRPRYRTKPHISDAGAVAVPLLEA